MLIDTLKLFKEGLQRTLNNSKIEKSFSLDESEKFKKAFLDVRTALTDFEEFKDAIKLGVTFSPKKSKITKNDIYEDYLIDMS